MSLAEPRSTCLLTTARNLPVASLICGHIIMVSGLTSRGRASKPTDNTYIETFNGFFRYECLNIHWFASLSEARRLIKAWRRDYNDSCPHMALKRPGFSGGSYL